MWENTKGMEKVIEIAVRYTYPTGKRVDLFFEAFEGEKVFVTGKTGCGKSTLMRVLNGLIPELYGGKLEGKVHIYGKKGNNRDVFLVTQYPEEQVICGSAVEEVAFPLIQRGWNYRDAVEVAEKTLEEFGIYHLASRDPHRLSDGEKQAVIVCGAVASGSVCLAFDEPFAHLHPNLAKKIVKMILKTDRTVILSEHRTELSDGFRVFNMNSGHEVLDKIRSFDLKYHHVSTSDFGKTLIAARDARVYRGKRVVIDGLNLKVKEGESIAITGVNGAGKTTLLRALAGFEKSEGINVEGKVGMAFQYPGYSLNSNTVGEEVSKELLSEFCLTNLSERHPHSLSGGEKRILSALKALEAKIVLLDEPTAGLDRELRRAFISRLVCIVKAKKKAAVIATHDHEIAEICDREVELEHI